MNLPEKMQFVTMAGEGEPDVLAIATGLVPQPQDNEILVKVAATALNRADLLQRKGKYPPPPGASPILGLEASGIVVARGKDSKRFVEGQKVCALLEGGGYAEYVAVPETQCLPMTGTLHFEHAAAVPEAVFTVWANVFELGALKEGETILIHGGTSGIGTLATSMARLHGAKIYATAGTAAKCKICEQRGAERAINYNAENFVDILLEETSGRGVDVVLDILGGDTVARNLQVLAQRGRHVSIALQQGRTAPVDLWRMMLKQLTITGSTLRHRPVDEKARMAVLIERQIWPWITSGLIKPLIYKKFPLTQAAAAHKVMESGEHSGKIVLEVASL
jgi:NADPH:quinone reductase